MASDESLPNHHRGATRAGDDVLAKTTVTLPRNLIAIADRLVVERKRQAPSFNRSALLEEALRDYLTRQEVEA
jgi:metal-responsive CopG/Arc/MetJ family transcriptional regulator